MPSRSVSLAAPHELMPALRLLFDHRPDPEGGREAERCRAALTASGDPTGVFVARDDAGRVCGAALVQALPGALGGAWPPRAETPEAEDALTVAACGWLKEQGVKVCQAFASAGELPGMAPLTRNGFRHVTQLVSLRLDLSDGPPVPGAGDPMRFVSEDVTRDAALAAQFTATFLATHEGTLDCPELNGTRTAAELALEVTGGEHYLAYNPTAPATPVGVVSLTGNAGPGVVELSYLGVVPSERGRGCGRNLLTFAITEAARSRATALTTSVDARNEPALRLYRRYGFAETERREVFLLQLPLSDL